MTRNRSRVLIALWIAAAVAVLIIVEAIPAKADDRCVTRAEHDRLRVGMSQPRVHQIFDFDGRHAYWANTRVYGWCNRPHRYTAVEYRGQDPRRVKSWLVLSMSGP